VDIVAYGWQEAAGIVYRGIYYCGRLEAASGLLGTEVALRNIVGNWKRAVRG
jgi:hypothetical protein